jgi:hypothetical protein
MARKTHRPPETDTDAADTAGPSLGTLAIVAVGGVMAVGAAFFVRPSPQLDQKAAAVVAPVVPSAVMALGGANEKPEPLPEPTPAQDPPPTPAPPALSPERQQLAKLMSAAAVEPAPAEVRPVQAAPPATVAPPPPAGVSAFAPPDQPSGALQAVASLKPPVAPTPGAPDEAEKKRMAEEAAKAIRDGDIPTARSILEKSLAAGDQAAVLALAETYDPILLAAMKVENVDGDLNKARELYEKASRAGLADARKRLAALKRYEHRH